jgi:N-acetylmuramoyl-L-alanine amidase
MIIRDDDGIRDEQYLKGDKDETVWGGQPIPFQQKARLWQRTNIINQLYDEHAAKGITDQTMISIHVDSRASNKKIDLFFYHHDTDLIGARQAERMQEVVRKKYDQVRQGRGYAGTVGARDLHVLRETKCSGVFIELGNITNPSDQVRIVEPRNRQLIADWLVEGLVR